MSKSDLLGTKMLLATDGSEGAEMATRAAIELAEGTGSELHVVYVEPFPDFMKKNGAGTPGYDRELYEMIEEEARETLRKLVWRVKVAGGTVADSHLRMGAVAEQIVTFAGELEVDLIIVGSRGLPGIRRTLAGSVSESVFRHAHCPVMVVRAKDNPPSRHGGGRLRARRVFSQEVRRATSALVREMSTPGRGLKAVVSEVDPSLPCLPLSITQEASGHPACWFRTQKRVGVQYHCTPL
jgi:nucleotide-binding universal stress UspA family protein